MPGTIIKKDMTSVFAELEKQISAQGMLMLCHINGQATAEKIGESVPAVRILEVFRPELAVRVWRAHQPAGIEIPVRLYLYENSEGHTVINRRSLAEAFEKYQLPALTRVGDEADEVISRIVALTADNA